MRPTIRHGWTPAEISSRGWSNGRRMNAAKSSHGSPLGSLGLLIQGNNCLAKLVGLLTASKHCPYFEARQVTGRRAFPNQIARVSFPNGTCLCAFSGQELLFHLLPLGDDVHPFATVKGIFLLCALCPVPSPRHHAAPFLSWPLLTPLAMKQTRP